MDKRGTLTSRVLWAAVLLLSAGWMVAFFLYVQEAIGWQNAVDTLLPHEIATLVLALVVPPLLLVALIAAFRVSSPRTVTFSPAEPAAIGWPAAANASITSPDQMHSACQGRPWCWRLRLWPMCRTCNGWWWAGWAWSGLRLR